MPTLIDTNILVYRVDVRFPQKRDRAVAVLRAVIATGDARIPYQAIVEFVAATTRSRAGQPPLLERPVALREADDLLACYDVIWPDEDVVRLALRGAALYQLSWFDALIWAHAERGGCDIILSEDFEDGRRYGRVRAQNPFI